MWKKNTSNLHRSIKLLGSLSMTREGVLFSQLPDFRCHGKLQLGHCAKESCQGKFVKIQDVVFPLYVWLKDVGNRNCSKNEHACFKWLCVYLHDEHHPNLSIGLFHFWTKFWRGKPVRLDIQAGILQICLRLGETIGPCAPRTVSPHACVEAKGICIKLGLWWDSALRSRTPSAPSQSPPVASSNWVQEVNHGRIFIPRRQAIDPPPRSHCIHEFFCSARLCSIVSGMLCRNNAPDLHQQKLLPRPLSFPAKPFVNLLVSSFHPQKETPPANSITL